MKILASGLPMMVRGAVSTGEVAVVDSLLAEAGLALGIGILIETTEGLERVAEIAMASPRIAFLMFGGADLAGELGTAIADEPLLYGRSRVVAAAVRAGVQVLDMPALDFKDAAAVRTNPWQNMRGADDSSKRQ